MQVAEMAALLIQGMAPPAGNSDTGFHIGTIISWDELSGVNTVTFNGTTVSNLKCIQGGIGVLYQPGDVVGIFRFQSTYFVWGKIAAPGAAAATQIRSARVAALVTVPLGAGFADLAGSPGPNLASVYIGSSRRCLVIHSLEIAMGGGSADPFAMGTGFQAVQVTGASSIAVETGITDAFSQSRFLSNGVYTASTVVTASNGLNQGFNTFTCKYRATADTGVEVDVNNRVLTVIPF